jgi:hypothetical protein
VDSLDSVASLLNDLYVEKISRQTFGDFEFLYFITDENGRSVAELWALLTSLPPTSVERI